MALVKFQNIESSISAMVNLHDVEIGGRKVKISFTKNMF
jgi:hypothetical protein